MRVNIQLNYVLCGKIKNINGLITILRCNQTSFFDTSDPSPRCSKILKIKKKIDFFVFD